MSQVIPVRCPHCGAGLQVDPRAESATCAYCGTTSLLRNKGTVVTNGTPVITVGPGRAKTALLVTVAVGVLGVVLAMYFAGPPSTPAPAPGRAQDPVEFVARPEPAAPATVDD
ncbi:MAG TPA: hypothetical protein VGB85_30225, partial [Nannocystis sp.]